MQLPLGVALNVLHREHEVVDAGRERNIELGDAAGGVRPQRERRGLAVALDLGVMVHRVGRLTDSGEQGVHVIDLNRAGDPLGVSRPLVEVLHRVGDQLVVEQRRHRVLLARLRSTCPRGPRLTPQQWWPVNGARYDDETVTRPGRRTTTSVLLPAGLLQAPPLTVSQRDQWMPTGTTVAAGASSTTRSPRTETAVATGPTSG